MKEAEAEVCFFAQLPKFDEVQTVIAISCACSCPRTVDTHRTNLMNKLDIHNVAGLIRFAFQNGIAG